MEFDIVFKLASLTIVGLLPISNPPTTATLLLGLGKGQSKEYINTQARLACIFLFLTLNTTFFVGSSILEIFNISMPGLRIGGGMIIGYIGFRMLFPVETAEITVKNPDSIAFVPLTIPSMCGPGTMALIISGAAEISVLPEEVHMLSVYVGVVLGFLGMSLIALFVLSMAYPMYCFLGKNGIDAFTRIMGFLLVCMGVQFCLNGFIEFYHTLLSL